MKKPVSIITLLTTIVVLSSCFRGPHTTIAYRNNNNEVKVEYSGTITFRSWLYAHHQHITRRVYEIQ